nr:hypothetical protein [Bradyrhizobium oropedii]
MAAHNPLSAILAEEARYDGLWASGFELSALYGLPNMSLMPMTQHPTCCGRSPDARRSNRPTSTRAMAMRSM